MMSMIGLLIIGLAFIVIVVAISMAIDALATFGTSRRETTENSIARVQHTAQQGRRAMDEISDQFLKGEMHKH